MAEYYERKIKDDELSNALTLIPNFLATIKLEKGNPEIVLDIVNEDKLCESLNEMFKCLNLKEKENTVVDVKISKNNKIIAILVKP